MIQGPECRCPRQAAHAKATAPAPAMAKLRPPTEEAPTLTGPASSALPRRIHPQEYGPTGGWRCGGVYGPEDEPGYSPPRARPLPKSVIHASLDAAKPQVHACYVRYGVPGTAMVNVRFARDGSARSVKVTGKLAGTQTGACVEAAVGTVRIPPGSKVQTRYPLQLR